MIRLVEYSSKQWEALSEDAHIAVFSESYDQEAERIDFAVLGISNHDDHVVGYATCRERSDKAIYMQFGGVLKKYRNSVIAYRAFVTLIDHLLKKYDRIFTCVKNTNFPMLKVYLNINAKIIGCKTVDDEVFLEILI